MGINPMVPNYATSTKRPFPTLDHMHSLQIPCDTDYTPPDNCLQYFTAITGTVQSYNFNGGDGPHLADQDQRICIRPARGYCTIGFAAAAIDATFGISGANAATAIVSK